ncbi:unnamed protein product [Didymodactylos carnosus]|uniref:Uncharacterized protein n=1 Tax=Didymodactylos carnosus TaxID=1234261 RepID=A0A815C7I8_9BILA|nr:unnamed protein product [Didymodactylos carnosus]CAF4080721.1 unnamed protein product [Didymodactylos carnosus]
MVPVPDVDRGPTDARNILAVIVENKYDKYKLRTENGAAGNVAEWRHWTDID